MDSEKRTLWCGNLSDKVTEELLYELFLQVAPLERVRIPTDKEGRKSNFGFVTLKHEVSVDYTVQLLNGTSLFDRSINVKPRNSNQNQPQQARFEPQPAQCYNNQNTMMNNFSDLLQMGQMLQLNYNQNQNQHQQFNQNQNQRHNNYGGRSWDNQGSRSHRHDRSNNSGGKHHPYWNEHHNHSDRNRRRY